LGSLSAADHALGWRIVASEPDVVRLAAAGPLLRGVIVARRRGTAVTVSTFVTYEHPVATLVWRLVGPLHRRIAPYLLERAAEALLPAKAEGSRVELP